VEAGNESFWTELGYLCEWAWGKEAEFYIQELGFGDAWVYQVEESGQVKFWRATLSLDGRWTLSPTY
jgi:hypothetical protein